MWILGNVKFMKVKRSENLDAKKLARIDKMLNVGNPGVRTSEDGFISWEKLGPKLNSFYAKVHFFVFFLAFSHNEQISEYAENDPGIQTSTEWQIFKN